MSQSGTLHVLAAHELRLGWRDWVALLTAGNRARLRNAMIVFATALVLMHLLAYALIGGYADIGRNLDKATLIVVTGILLLSWSLLLSQAMESVTREFYSRSDLDLILTAPVSAHSVFAVRILRIALSITGMSLLLATPFITVLTARGGAIWLCAYGVLAAMGMAAVALGVALTVGLFRLFGPKRTRFVAQILAAMIGAAFVIGLQVAAILSYGTLSRFSALQSQWLLAHAPEAASAWFLPARALLGDGTALAIVMLAALISLLLAILLFSRRLAAHIVTAAGVAHAVRRAGVKPFHVLAQRRALRQKEWTLLRRDPWLLSQTLMQLLYLLPPALLLWRDFAGGLSLINVIVPVIVMAAGQLGGGLAWLALSGEDAPELIATAPLASRAAITAKIEAVIGAILLVFAPFLIAIAFLSARAAAISALGILASAAAATFIQFRFRVQAKRSQFRRRQTASRLATFAEAFSSIAIAATAALAAAGNGLWLFPAIIALALLSGVGTMSRRRTAS